MLEKNLFSSIIIKNLFFYFLVGEDSILLELGELEFSIILELGVNNFVHIKPFRGQFNMKELCKNHIQW